MMNWKAIAIVFIILFLLETAYIGYSINYYNQEVENQNECFYDICSTYPDAYYELGICYCIDEYNNWGNGILV